MFLFDHEDDAERQKVYTLLCKRSVGITSEFLFLQNIPPNVYKLSVFCFDTLENTNG